MTDEIKILDSKVTGIQQHGDFLFIHLSTDNSEFVNNTTVIQLYNPEKRKIEVK